MNRSMHGVTQCVCGILFEEPHVINDAWITHLQDGTHEKALAVEMCGPCFTGYCIECDRGRRLGPQIWKCRCMHDFPRIFHNSKVAVHEIITAWSDWLLAGRPSTVSLGLEEKTK